VLGCDADGVELWFHACWMSGVRRRRLVLTGESGSLSLEEDDDALALWLERHGERDLLSRTEKCDRGTPIEGALRAFADGVQGTPDLRAAADAVTVVSVLEQVSEASRARLSVVPAPGCWL
jgi:predicted dehydrogenase